MVNSLSGTRILVAEDNPINRKIVQIMLQKAGCEVVAVDNGRQVCNAVEAEYYHLILMDLHMPQMDGLAATGFIRNLPGQVRHIPIVALTASAFTEDRDRCLAAGMNDFITKPIKLDFLIEKCLQWTSNRPSLERSMNTQAS